FAPGDIGGIYSQVPVVKAGQTLQFFNNDAPRGNGIWHTITSCKAPCDRSTGVAYPLADGNVQFDSGELGVAGPPTAGRLDWTVKPSDTVFVGYRIQELFAAATVKRTATGRTPKVRGTMSVSGRTIPSAQVAADLTGLTSDQARRDSAIRERGLETGRFPEATFTLTAPITLPSTPVKGTSYRVTATGDLVLHGVTRSVQVALEAKWNGST